MALKVNDRYLSSFVAEHEYKAIQPAVTAAHETLTAKNGLGNDFLGWTTLPADYDKDEFARIKAAAEKIKKNSEVLIVIGIGGSYLGARAAIEALRSSLYNSLKKDTPEIYFIGNTISPTYLNEVISLVEGRDFSVNVISKSGTTTEPALAFRVFRALLEKKYGAEGAKERIFATTDKKRGTLKELSDEPARCARTCRSDPMRQTASGRRPWPLLCAPQAPSCQPAPSSSARWWGSRSL